MSLVRLQVRNEPKNICVSAEYISKIKGVSLEKVMEVTTQNALQLFPKLKAAIRPWRRAQRIFYLSKNALKDLPRKNYIYDGNKMPYGVKSKTKTWENKDKFTNSHPSCAFFVHLTHLKFLPLTSCMPVLYPSVSRAVAVISLITFSN